MTSAAPQPPPVPLAPPAPVRETVLGVEWVVRGDAVAALCAAKALDVRSLGQSADARVTEESPERTTFRVRLPAPGSDGLEIEATIFKRTGLPGVAFSIFHRARATRAWRAAEALEAAGIPARLVLAAGTRRSLGVLRDDVLLAEATDPDVSALPAFLDTMDASARARFVRRTAPVLARMVRHLHGHGLAYREFDARCVLVRKLAGGERQLLLGELDRLRVGGATSLGRRLDNLAQLAASLDGISRTDRRRFWNEYVAGPARLGRRNAGYTRLVESHAEELRRRRWARTEREARGDHVYFKRVRAERWRGHTVRAYMKIEREVLSRIPARGMAMPDATVIKDAPEARIYEQRIEFGAGTETIIVKHKRRVGAGAVLRTFLRRVGAVPAWRTLWALRVRGIPVEPPLAAFERRCCGLTFESVLVTKKVADAENLFRFAEQLLGSASDVAQSRRVGTGVASSVSSQAGAPVPHKQRLRRELARALGALVRRLHDAGFAQRDLKAANILVHVAPGGADVPVCPRTGKNACPTMTVTLTLVDVEGVERYGEVPPAIRARDLGRLAADFVRMAGVGATDFARVLDSYLAGGDVSRAEKRALVRGIRERVREKLAAWDAKG